MAQAAQEDKAQHLSAMKLLNDKALNWIIISIIARSYIYTTPYSVYLRVELEIDDYLVEVVSFD